MIYEDNEDKPENGKESSSPNADKSDSKKDDPTSSFDEKSSSSQNRKSKVKKKRHHQQLQQQQFQLQSDDQLLHEIIEEILKLENLTNLLNKNQHDELKNLVKSEMKLFQNLKKMEMNFVSLLVGPIMHISPNASMSLEEEDQRFENLMRKLHKNLDLLKKAEPGSETKSTGDIYNDDEYLQSLRKSLDRHNSMQLLLHMQNPNLQSSSQQPSPKPSVLTSSNFLVDDQLDCELESSSPPPPAPNGDVYYPADESYEATLEQEWNPFHVDLQRATLSPYRTPASSSSAQQAHVSPKNTKSDSGLSSMSGFSSFEKSPNSPSYSLPYDRMRSQEYAKILSGYQAMQDGIYGEENLNYIKELAHNVPICSVYENKSIFDNVGSSGTVKPPSAWDMYMKNQQERLQQAQEETSTLKGYPDLIANQEQQLEALIEQRRKLDLQKQQLKQEQQQLQAQMQQKSNKKRQQLVYYPSQQSITDYNSSMNLEYQREYQSHQSLPHDEFMKLAHAQQQVGLQRQQRMEQEMPTTSTKKPSSKHQYLNKKIEKVQNWLPEIKSIKKMSKRNRSNSLPGQVESDENFTNYKMNLKKPPSSSSGGKKGDIYVMKNYMKGKKKEIVRTMSSKMTSMVHKAQKTYRRHSFSHHHLSDDENQTQNSPKSHQRTTRSLSSGRYSDTEASSDISSIFSDSESCAAPLFATMGDSMTKPSDAGDSDRNSSGDKAIVSDSSTGSRKPDAATTNSQDNQFNLNFTSTSMEFAASRKVGMLRKKSSTNEEQDDVSPTECDGTAVVFEKTASVKKHQSLMKTHSIFVDSIDGDERPVPAPRTTSMGMPDEQQGMNNNNGNSIIAPKPIPSPRFEHSRSNSMKNSLSTLR